MSAERVIRSTGELHTLAYLAATGALRDGRVLVSVVLRAVEYFSGDVRARYRSVDLVFDVEAVIRQVLGDDDA